MKKNYLLALMATTLTAAGIVAATQSGERFRKDAVPTPGVMPAPAQSDEDVVTMFGSLEQSNNPDWQSAQKYGVYSFSNTSESDLTAAGPVASNHVTGGGFYCDGYFYFIQGSSMNTGSYVENTFVKMNTETWKIEDRRTHTTPTKTVCEAMAYDYTTATAYAAGLVLNSATPYMLRTVDMVTGEMTDVGKLNERFTAMAFDGSGQLWGIARPSEFPNSVGLYKIDKTTGESTKVGDLGYNQKSQYSAATFDLRTGKLYWTARTYTYNADLEESYVSHLFEVDTNTGKATPVKTFDYNEVFSSIYIPDCHAKAPEGVGALDFVYGTANLSGKVSCTLPSRCYDRTSLTGKLKVEVYLDNTLVQTVESASPGSAFESDEISLTSGAHTAKVVCYNGDGQKGYPMSVSVWGGIDLPSQVGDLKVEVNKKGDTAVLSWTAPTVGKGNGNFDLNSLTYKVVRRPDGVTVAENLTECTYTDVPDRPMLLSQYEVYAVTADGQSDPAYSQAVLVGSAYPVTYLETFDTQRAFNTYTVIDLAGNASADGDTWMWYDIYKEAIYWLNYNAYNPADAWLITPTIALDPDKSYTVSFSTQGYASAALSDDWGQTRFTIAIGEEATAESLDRVLHVEDYITSQTPRVINTVFVPENNECRIGFHLESNGDDHASVDNVRVAEYGSAYIPGAPTDVTAENEDGVIVIKAKAPVVNAKGQPITELTSIGLHHSGYGSPFISIDNVQPGEEVTFRDENPVYGENRYEVCAVNAEGKGMLASVSCSARPDVPKSVESLVVKPVNDGRDAELSWEYPADMLGVNGKKLKESDITYNVYATDGINRTLIKEGLTETSYLIQDVMSKYPGERQRRIAYEITAQTDGGEGEGSRQSAILGRSYELPLTDNFGDTSFAPYEYGPSPTGGFSRTPTGYDPRVDAATGGYLLSFYVSGEGGNAQYITPRLNLASRVNPKFRFTMYNCNDSKYNYASCIVRIGVITEEDGVVSPVEYVGTSFSPAGEAGWKDYEVDLSKYGNCTRASVVIYANSPDRNTRIHFDKFEITGEKTDYDARVVDIAGPTSAVMGRENRYTVTAHNNGKNDLDNVTVTLRMGDLVIGTRDIALNEDESIDVPFTYTPALNEETRDAVLTATVETDRDGNRANDEAIFRMSVVCPNLPYVTDLKGENGGDHIRLSWSDASKYPGAVPETDDVESYTDFAIDNVGDWIMYDGDGQDTMLGISSNYGDYEWTNCGKPQAFIVFNPSAVGVSALCTARSGERCFVAFNARVANNDWLISPALNDEAQTISFYVREMLAGYGYAEVYDLMISYTGTNPEDFTVFAPDVRVASGTWTRQSYTLPAGVRHFAIVCKSVNQYALMIDDIEFIPAQPAVELTGYNVYRDGELIATDIAENEHKDFDVDPAKDYDYNVTATYTDGESIFSNTVSIGILGLDSAAAEDVDILGGRGAVKVLGAAGEYISVYTLDGKCIYSFKATEDAESLSVAAGMYVVRAGKKVAKVVVK